MMTEEEDEEVDGMSEEYDDLAISDDAKADALRTREGRPKGSRGRRGGGRDSSGGRGSSRGRGGRKSSRGSSRGKGAARTRGKK